MAEQHDAYVIDHIVDFNRLITEVNRLIHGNAKLKPSWILFDSTASAVRFAKGTGFSRVEVEGNLRACYDCAGELDAVDGDGKPIPDDELCKCGSWS